jgi:nitroimidazol reductase NimA-like FMN-containing flavoprotein (pyridoxamine 5'-phosphate oxidase superfamily)
MTAAAEFEVRRNADRASYDRDVIHGILDEAMYCNVGFITAGHPYVIPTIHVRADDTVILHSSAASRMLRTPQAGAAASAVTGMMTNG